MTSYYNRIRGDIDKPQAVSLCDSLYARAGALGIVRTQVVALCLRLDHYYYRNDCQQIVDGVRRVKEFCAAHPDEDLRYFYYFAWGSRLITYYIKQNQFNVAVYETRKMLTEAQRDNYSGGIAACYRMLGNLYMSQGEFRIAYQNFCNQISELERAGSEDINLPTQYASAAQCALELDMPDSALLLLRKAKSRPRQSHYQNFTVDKAFALYYLKTNNLPAAGRHLEAVEKLFREDSLMSSYRAGLYYLRTEFYKASGEYEKALDAALRSQQDTLLRKTDFTYYALSRDVGDIYYRMNDMRHAADNYRDYIQAADSVHTRQLHNSTEDFSGLLELGRLHNENREMQLDLQHRKLQYTYMFAALLSILLIAGGVIFVRVVKLNRRLKVSEARVTAQNEHLRAVGEELRAAKERAEQANFLKSGFIQNMSHEVRTPLNSIVGFSQVLASQFGGDAMLTEYASIIESNSRDLLRLIDDVLDISLLDRTETLPLPDVRQMDGCCRECADRILQEVQPGVAVICECSPGNPVVRTNVRRVVQVLMHLLHNAAKFTTQGQIILNYSVSPSSPGRQRFVVSDTGPGIPAHMCEEVFERFVKLDAFSQGPGLGLSVCRIIAEKLGGRLYVDPTYTQGCRVIFEVACGEV